MLSGAIGAARIHIHIYRVNNEPGESNLAPPPPAADVDVTRAVSVNIRNGKEGEAGRRKGAAQRPRLGLMQLNQQNFLGCGEPEHTTEASKALHIYRVSCKRHKM